MEDIFLISFLLATPIQFWAGRTFYRQAWAAASTARPTCQAAGRAGTTAAWGYSTYVTFFTERVHQSGLMAEIYFDSAAVIIGLILLGRYLEARQAADDRRDQEADGGWRPRRRVSCAAIRSWTCRSSRWWPAT